MNDYPLSAKSSKKRSNNTDSLHSSILERSACHNQIPNQLSQSQYKHILEGERVFIELYYQGRVIPTGYNEWIVFMGGTLYKRLNSKVTIFLTNTDDNQIRPILQRVRKTCSNCKVISILWFQQCFQQKKKVPFTQFILDENREKSQGSKEKQEKCQIQLQGFLKNIGQDIIIDCKSFLKDQKQFYFSILPKNHNNPPEQTLEGKEINLGPNPNKKVRGRTEHQRKKRKSSNRIQESHESELQQRQSKSLGAQLLEDIACNKQQQKQANHQGSMDEVKMDNGKGLLQNLMTKYLGEQRIEDKQDSEQRTVTADQVGQVDINNTLLKVSEKQEQRRVLAKKSQSAAIIVKKVNKSCTNTLNSKTSIQTNRYTFSSVGTRYKNLNLNFELQILKKPLSDKLQQVENSIKKLPTNGLILISFESNIQSKVQAINNIATHHSSIKVFHIEHSLYQQYINCKTQKHQAYFLINPKKILDRVIYYSLIVYNSNKITLVNYRLVQELKAYNQRILEMNFKTPRKIQTAMFRFMREIHLSVKKEQIIGKRVALLQSQLPKYVQKKVIQAMGGYFVGKQQYLLSAEPDLIVSNKWGLKEKGKQTINEEQLWRNALKLQGQNIDQ